VLVQCNKTALYVNPNTRLDHMVCLLLDNAYICAAIAKGAVHQKPIGSKAVLRSTPDKADRSRFTNPRH